MLKIENKKFFSLFLFIVFIYIFLLSNKEDFHLDESTSFILSTYNSYGFNKHFDEDILYSSQDIIHMMYEYTDSIGNTFHDIYSLYLDNRDRPHTNFYYSLLRLALFNNSDDSLQSLTIRASLLNIIISILSFIIFFCISKKLFKTDSAIITAITLAFLSPAAFSSVLFFRPYHLQSLFFIIGIYIFYNLIEDINNKSNTNFVKNIKKSIIYSFLISLIILTGYFSLFYIFPFFIILIYLSYTKNKNAIPLIIYISLLSIIFTFILYPKYFYGFFSDRASEALTLTTASNFFHNLTKSLTAFWKIVSFFLCGTAGLILIIIFMLYNRKNISSFFWMGLIISSITFSLCSIILAPYKTLRYVMPVFPVYALIITQALDLKNKHQYKIFSILILFLFINLFFTTPEHYLTKIKNVPDNGIIITSSKNPWKPASLAPYFHGEYSFKSSCPPQNWYMSQAVGSIFFIDDQCLKNIPNDYIDIKFFNDFYKIGIRKPN